MFEVLIAAAKAGNRMLAGSRTLLVIGGDSVGAEAGADAGSGVACAEAAGAGAAGTEAVLALAQPLRGLGAHVTLATHGDLSAHRDGAAPDFIFADEQTLLRLLKDPAALAALGASPAQLPPLLVGVTAVGSVFAPSAETRDCLESDLGDQFIPELRDRLAPELRDRLAPELCDFLAQKQQRAGVLEFSLPVAGGQGSGGSPADNRNIALLLSSNPQWRSADPAARIAWAARGMPVTAGLISELAERGSISGDRVLVSLVLEPKTAALALKLRDTGAKIAVFASASETDPGIAAALADAGVYVFAATDNAQLADPELDADNAAAALAWQPHWLVDDGAHLIRLAHTEAEAALQTLRGAAEETTSGIRPLNEMASAGELRMPVIAVNDAATKTLFDNRVGTGESCVIATLDQIAQSHGCDAVRELRQAVVYGYGPVGQGCARAARSFGLTVSVIEPDPVRALSAVVDGFAVGGSAQLLPRADLVISATGVWNTVGHADQGLLRPGAFLSVAGGIDGEIAQPVAPGLRLLADGGGINYTAGEGNPLEVMDLSFATQVAALSQLTETVKKGAGGESLPPDVYPVNDAAVKRVASMALRVYGYSLPQLPATERVGGAAQHWRVHRYKKTN
ncbi:adenosylhomocysteinase [Leucobacter sp. OH1287]|uniref:adenosylhomocysteinase n=1 Tax=Leucobacter sp. OH1287 TaxID=2491049 RepID=UPI001F1E5977|nr:adenosylhomocysteinase [Leucobacter sp. OH1287]